MALNRVRIEGAIGGTAERWSVGFACNTSVGAAVADPVEISNWCDAMLAQFAVGTGWPGTVRSMLGVGSTIDRISAYYYSTPSGPAIAGGESTTAGSAGSGTIVAPFQSSLVVSLLTGTPGGSYRGRMYWPFLTAVLVNGKISTSSVTLSARALAFSEMLTALCNEAETFPGLRPAIASRTTGAVTPVTSVRVGDVIDTQRRRRDALVESFGTAVVA